MPKNTAMVPVSIVSLEQRYDRTKYNSLLPTVEVGQIPDCFEVSVAIVSINAKDKTQAYSLPGGQYGLTKQSLHQLKNAAGVRFGPGAIRRLDDGSRKDYYEYAATATVTDFDGTVRSETATKALDLRQDAGDGEMGKDAKAAVSPGQLQQTRKFGDGHAASKAKLRAIADILGIRRSYTIGELAKAFVVPRMRLNANDADAKRVLLAIAADALGTLFGSGQQPAQLAAPEPDEPPDYDPNTGEVLDAEIIGPAPPLEEPPAPAPPPAAEEPSLAEKTSRLSNAWRVAKTDGMGEAGWRVMLGGLGVPPKKEDMCGADVDAIERAVANLGGEKR